MYSNKDCYQTFFLSFIERRFPVSAGRSAGTSFTPHCCLPALKCAWVQWTGKLAAKQPGSRSGWLCSLGGIAADGVSSQNFKFQHWPAEMCAYRLLGSDKPGHIWIERSISCQKDWWLSSRQRVPTWSFVWTNSVGKWQLFHCMLV